MQNTSTNLTPGVNEWQQQEQIDYWKSPVISLEFENQMLWEHIRHVYAQTIKEFQMYSEEIGEDDEGGTTLNSKHLENVTYDVQELWNYQDTQWFMCDCMIVNGGHARIIADSLNISGTQECNTRRDRVRNEWVINKCGG